MNLSVVIPVPIGELYDKCTILKIKYERIIDVDKRAMVRKELDYLQPFLDIHLVDIHEREFFVQLKTINETLWDIEDRLRVKEVLGEFDQEFIQLARSVYQTNDLRARVKWEINQYTGSEIAEIKSYASIREGVVRFGPSGEPLVPLPYSII